MAVDHIRSLLHHAHDGHYLVKIRAVNSAGNTVEVVGYVTEIRDDGCIRVCQGDAEHGPVHEFASQRILGIERTHGS